MSPLIPLFLFNTFSAIVVLVVYITELISFDVCALLFFILVAINSVVWVKKYGAEPLLMIVVYLAYCLPVLATHAIKDTIPDCYTMLIWLYASGLIGWTTGISLIMKKVKKETPKETSHLTHNAGLLLSSVLLTTVAGCYYLYLNIAAYGSLVNFLFIGRSISGAGTSLGGTMVYGTLVVFCTGVVIIFSQLYLSKQYFWGFLLISVPILFFLALGNRSAPSYILLGALAVLLKSGWRPTSAHWIMLATGSFLTVGPLGQARLFWHQGLDRVFDLFSWEWFDLSNSELAAGINTTTTILQDRYYDWKLGETYLGGLINGLPSFLQFAEYKRPAIWYLERYMPDYYEAGFGAGFSPVTEAYMNFGNFGPLAVMLLAGALFGIAISSRPSGGAGANLVQFVAIASFLNFNRIDFSAWFVQLLFSLMTVYIVIGLMKVISNRKKEHFPSPLPLS